MNTISAKICLWYNQNKRDLPWRHTKNPYNIWLSEIILQQTRVVQGLDYYLRFVNRFPSVSDLAAANEDEVLKLWQGLGYYSRARNLHAAARQVMSEMDGIFPHSYDKLIKLKGVGPYTAAAIASLSSDEQVAVVDGNVYRVLSRIYDLDLPIDSGIGQKQYLALATQLLPEQACGMHNQAMMELGALCCTPASPQCHDCPVSEHCLARAHNTIMLRPVKTGRIKVRERHFTYIIYIYNEHLWVHQRGAGDIWQGLWEPYLMESFTDDNQMAGSEQMEMMIKLDKAPLMEQQTPTLMLQRKHQLTHQTLYADFWVCALTEEVQAVKLNDALKAEGYKMVSWPEWQSLAVPRLIDEANRYLSKGWF